MDRNDSSLFLGLDLSTQQLKAILISDSTEVVQEFAVDYDHDLPHFETTKGAIHGPGGEATSPVQMWVEALDLLIEKMAISGVRFNSILAIGGSGQQHGSVYWSHDAEGLLANLNPDHNLATQLCPWAFSLSHSPIWQDASTQFYCQALESAAGGAQALADITGSRAHERFTGPQIAKIKHINPNAYISTSQISLISSFLASLFLGHIAPIEVADASGMNLMNILTCEWEESLLLACGGNELRSKLGTSPVLGEKALGNVCNWWVKRWGFNPECIVSPFTGDNPATILPFSTPGDAVLSLGTSTTVLLSIPPGETPPQRFTNSHLLAHSTASNAYIAMLCFKNGALAREKVRDRYAEGSWTKFNELVNSSPPGNNGFVGLYFPLPEIIPSNLHGSFFFSTEDGLIQPVAIEKVPDVLHPRAILESQFLSIQSRIKSFLPRNTSTLNRLIITGGAASNPVIQQMAADVFGVKIFVIGGYMQAAAAGGALLARYAWWGRQDRKRETFEMTMKNTRPFEKAIRLVAEPQTSEVYEKLVEVYENCEGAARAHTGGKLVSVSQL